MSLLNKSIDFLLNGSVFVNYNSTLVHGEQYDTHRQQGSVLVLQRSWREWGCCGLIAGSAPCVGWHTGGVGWRGILR